MTIQDKIGVVVEELSKFDDRKTLAELYAHAGVILYRLSVQNDEHPSPGFLKDNTKHKDAA